MTSPLFEWRKALLAPEFPCSAAAQGIGFVLSMHMDRFGGSCYPSVPTIAREARRAESTVVKALAELEAAGYLEIERPEKQGRGRTSEYQARLPEKPRPGEPFLPQKPPRDTKKAPVDQAKPPDGFEESTAGATPGRKGLRASGKDATIAGAPAGAVAPPPLRVVMSCDKCDEWVPVTEIGRAWLCDDCATLAAYTPA